MSTVLVTGGAGYIGSHCAKAFAEAGWDVVTLDNLSRGHRRAVRWGPLIKADLLDQSALDSAMRRYRPDIVAHFAAFAYVEESVRDPASYYRNNVGGTLALLESMQRHSISSLVFSSTCATYGLPVRLPMDETHPQAPINPYGWSKLFVERMLENFHSAYGLESVSLRYFNAAGCEPTGVLGEWHEPETHVIPLALEAALDPRRSFTVFGTDFDTPDGSAVRDFVHVDDLADAHVAAARLLRDSGGLHHFNLGTGTGTSVLDILAAVRRHTGLEPRVCMEGRRPGDPHMLVATPEKARRELGWTASRSSIDNIVGSALAAKKRQEVAEPAFQVAD